MLCWSVVRPAAVAWALLPASMAGLALRRAIVGVRPPLFWRESRLGSAVEIAVPTNVVPPRLTWVLTRLLLDRSTVEVLVPDPFTLRAARSLPPTELARMLL